MPVAQHVAEMDSKHVARTASEKFLVLIIKSSIIKLSRLTRNVRPALDTCCLISWLLFRNVFLWQKTRLCVRSRLSNGVKVILLNSTNLEFANVGPTHVI
jgi:hypothetical protein